MEEETNQNQEQNTPDTPEHHKWLWPLVVVLVLVAIGVSAWAVYNKKTDKKALSPSTYVNTAYGYSFEIPEGYRFALDYMKEWNASIPLSITSPETAEYLVLTLASEEDERIFLNGTNSLIGNHDFAHGRTIFIQPRTTGIDNQKQMRQRIGGSEITDISLPSGLPAVQIRYEPEPRINITAFTVQCRTGQTLKSGIASSEMESINIRFRHANQSDRDITDLLAVVESISCE